MGAGHSHGAAPPGHASGRHRRALILSLALLGTFFVVELVGGLVSGSLALLSDAGHMLTDVLGLAMSLAAIQAAMAGTANRQRTYGLYRLEILAALANAVLLAGLAAWIIWEAIQRLSQPADVEAGLMLVVATIGLVVNLVVLRILRDGSEESLNMEGARLEVLADTLGSVAAVVAALVIRFTGFARIDAIFGILLGLWVLPRTFNLARKAVRILVQAAPPHLDVEVITRDLAAIHGVVDVHDLHVWTLTSGMDVASVHMSTDHVEAGHRVLDAAKRVLRDDHAIGHATVQIDPPEHGACDDCDALTF
ncbi:MAG TPA: cation diffusion facilitator family transporter [Nitriliruptoraceae bacterium]|nr:cation diffusion facilitator family transporter [Nitriliruptoraceae bacterium]